MTFARRISAFAALLAALTSTIAHAQSGVLTGRVSNAEGGKPLAGAAVQLLLPNGAVIASAATQANGIYRLQVTPGTYLVKIMAVGFSPMEFPGVGVRAGTSVTRDAVLEARPPRLADVFSVTAVSRSPQKKTDAPGPIFLVTRTEVAERPALTVVDHLKSIPGVDISQGGLVQSNVVARGFNNIFSGALLTLIDYRAAAVPSLRVNVPAFFPITNDDIETVELVLGPGAALYGPNASNGVLSITTRSPFSSPGTTLSLEAGARAGSSYRSGTAELGDDGGGLWRVSGRHAMRLGSKVAVKLSGSYLKGTEWRARDSTERVDLDTRHPELGIPAGRCNSLTGCRDFNLEQSSGEARIDVRPDAKTEIIGSLGLSDAVSLIEYTGLGAVQARDWKYTSGQLRFRRERLFIQAFANLTGAGLDGARPRTYLLQDGTPIVDQSRAWSAQFQHGLNLFGARTSVLYGADYTRTNPRTGGTINGLNEDDDTIDEVGGYLHSVTHLTLRLEAVAALRVDKHNRLSAAVWSPRVALVFKPSETQALRVTFNRAFSTPENTDLFLDLRADHITLDEASGLGYDVRGLGVPSKGGFQFRVNGGCAGGVDGLCMRSPFISADVALPANAALLWSAAVAAVCAPGSPIPGAVCQVTGGAPAPTTVGTQLRRLNPTSRQFEDITPDQVTDIAPIKPTISSDLEVGYKALLGRKFQVSVDAWFEHKKDFGGALVVESPNVFLDRTSTIAYLTQVYTQAGIPGAADVAAQVGTAMAGLSSAPSMETTGVPLGTVVPTNSPLTARPDIFLTYRNFGSVNLWGADVALDYAVNSHLTLSGTYSFVNKDFFPRSELHGPVDVALNASRSKGSATVAWRDDPRGWSTELRFRAVKGFPVISGVYVSAADPNEPGKLLPTDSYGVLDAQAAWRPPFGARKLMLSANLENALNQHYSTFVGLPKLGRLLVTKMSYTF